MLNNQTQMNYKKRTYNKRHFVGQNWNERKILSSDIVVQSCIIENMLFHNRTVYCIGKKNSIFDKRIIL